MSIIDKIKQVYSTEKDQVEVAKALINLLCSDRKEQVLEAFRFACDKLGFGVQPASTKYHLCEEGGLIRHSNHVVVTAFALLDGLRKGQELIPTTLGEDLFDIKPESLLITTLFHDLGKCGEVGRPHYIKCEATEKQKKYGYAPSQPYTYSTNQRVYFPVPQRSINHIITFIDLLDCEIQAILTHDGMYVEENRVYAMKQCPLAILTHYADLWSGLIIERK